MTKRHLMAILIAATVLSVVLALAAIPFFLSSRDTHASNIQQNQHANSITTLNGLVHTSVIGSTQFIVDKTGHTASVDANPHDVQIVPSTPNTTAKSPYGSLRTGDLVATNIGNQDTGKTLVVFPAAVGPAHQLNTTRSSFSGLAKEAFNIKTGTDWVTNFSKNAVEIFNPNGTLFTTVTSSHFYKPWGIASNDGLADPQAYSIGSFFVANAGDATIDRIDIVLVNGSATFKIVQIARLARSGYETKIALTWAPTFKIKNTQYTDVLLALDPTQNRVVAFPKSTTTSSYTTQGITAFQGKPLNNPGGIALNPFNNDLLVVNLNDNNLLELNTNTGMVVGTHLLDTAPVDLKTGNGSALFGVSAGKDRAGNLVVYFTDDNTNTVDMLSL
jgi:hypothetical protein